jgi:glyoxylase-like metal-dependent hydrolase (beta-lactamase superfamily II)
MSTPGHAWHHHTYCLGEIAFCGDAAGVCLNNSPWVSLPSPPPEFNLEAWRQTLDRLQAESFAALYLTHFGRVDHVQQHLEQVQTTLEEMSEFVRVRMEAGLGRNQLVKEYIGHAAQSAEARGLTEASWQQYESVIPTFMSADGMIRYWQRWQQI